ncbi:hypothetical protein Syun_021251 [Stephania yunnanensis]|uniref:BZIP domain-containing protein n=1 Tax=Stephania yunnanensis TaxID=152371 RepID=A0AAP0IFB4_9MAGN
MKAHLALHGRWFDGKMITRTYTVYAVRDASVIIVEGITDVLEGHASLLLVEGITVSKSPFVGDKSPSDKAEEHQPSVVDERRHRRMISNRESARRSRMRKQKHLDELWSQVLRLRNENRQLIDKLNQVSDSHDRILKENSTLREEATELRRMLHEAQLKNQPYCPLRELEVPCNTAHLRAESSNQSIASSMDLLH